MRECRLCDCVAARECSPTRRLHIVSQATGIGEVILTDRQWVRGPFYGAPYGISLPIQEYSHGIHTGIAGHQKLAFSGDDSDIGVGRKVELRRVDLCHRQYLSQGCIGKID